MRTRFLTMSIYSFLAFLFFAIQQVTDWILISLSGIRGLPYFIDLSSVLKSSDCAYQYGWGIYDPEIAEGCSYIYGSGLIRIFHIFHISQSATNLGGWLLLLAFSIFIGTTLSVLKIKRTRHWILAALVLFSPPTMLLVERANIDILVVLLLAGSALALSGNRMLVLYVMLFISSISKFYTAPLFLWLALVQKTFAKRIAALAIFVVSVFLILSDLTKINGNFPRNSWASFGNPIFGIYGRKIDYEFSPWIQNLIGLSLLGFAAAVLLLLIKKLQIDLPKENFETNRNYVESLTRIFSLVFLLCYFASANYDYRLIFLFVPAVFFLVSNNLNPRTEVFLTLCLIATAWFSYNAGYLQILGDLTILPWVLLFIRSALSELWFYLQRFRSHKRA